MTYLSLLLRAAAQNEVVDELHRGVVHLDVDGFDQAGDVALLVALGNGAGFVELAVLESAGNLLDEDARLLASGAVHERAVNHNTERINRKNEQDADHGQGQRSHVVDHAPEIPVAALQKQG